MRFNDGIQLVIVGLDLICREVLNNDWEKNHAKFLVDQVFGVAKLEEKDEKVIPLLIGNEDFTKGTYYVSNVLLDDGNWFFDKASKKELLSLLLVLFGEMHPQISNNFAEINACNLSDVLLWAAWHQNQQVL